MANGNYSSRRVEHLIYLSMLVLVYMFPLLTETFNAVQGHPFQWENLFDWWIGVVPYLILFLIHNYLILPGFIKDHNIRKYSLKAFAVLVLYAFYEYLVFRAKGAGMPMPEPRLAVDSMPPPIPRHRFLIPLPILVNFLMAIFVIGMNLSLFLLFNSQREQESRKALENIRLQDELKYLKTQVNPHFFMNMLNNIHAMVEMDPVKAQDMILELSNLMRYVLYEAENQVVALSDELRFISSYVALMRQRYPEEKVSIRLDIPVNLSGDMRIPPLMFIPFVENAFKHGISYLKKSEIDIRLEQSDGKVAFFCRNTRHSNNLAVKKPGGVGLDNIRRRLSLIYGDSDMLEIEDTEEFYIVKLEIPCLSR